MTVAATVLERLQEAGRRQPFRLMAVEADMLSRAQGADSRQTCRPMTATAAVLERLQEADRRQLFRPMAVEADMLSRAQSAGSR